MNTATFPIVGAEPSLLGELFRSVRSLFRRADNASTALVASLASELRSRPELPARVLSLRRVSRRARTATLRRLAGNLRGDWENSGAADALRRMASRAALFRAVARELRDR